MLFLLYFVLAAFCLKLNLVPLAREAPTPSVRYTRSSKININLFKNTANIIKLLDDTKNSFIYDHNVQSWYSYELLGEVETKLLNTSFPATACLDNVAGGTGLSVDMSYEVGLQITNSLSGLAGLIFYGETFSLMIGLEVGTSRAYAGSFSCGVDRGQIGQITLLPFVVQTPTIRRTKVTVYEDSVEDDLSEHDEDEGESNTFEPMILLAQSTPAQLHCVTAPSHNDPNLKCFEPNQYKINPEDVF